MKKSAIILSLGILVLTGSNAQIINTIAGDSAYGFSGDGGAATAAELYYPMGIALDGSGNLYIADEQNNRIRKVNTAGIISTIAGNGNRGYSGDGGAATAAELNYPTGVAVDGSGNVYIADEGNNRIREVNTSGIMSTIAGNDSEGYSGDGGAATAAELYAPGGIEVDDTGNIYIGDTFNNRIRKITATGIISTIAGNGYGAPSSGGFSGDGGAATSAELYTPIGVAVDGSGNVYIADEGNSRIRQVTAAGVISTIAGDSTYGYSGDGGAATAAELGYPTGVALDSSGNVYIADWWNSRIRKVNTKGIISTIAGDSVVGYSGDGGAATDAEINHPFGILVDISSNIYIGDCWNYRIRKVTGVTGIEQLTKDNGQWAVYPNPNDGVFTIQSPLPPKGCTTLEVYNVLGEKVYSGLPLNPHAGTLKQCAYTIDLSGSTSGVYFYRVVNEEGALVGEGKFVIIKN
jgi:sugar lactone lactonase YvrE